MGIVVRRRGSAPEGAILLPDRPRLDPSADAARHPRFSGTGWRAAPGNGIQAAHDHSQEGKQLRYFISAAAALVLAVVLGFAGTARAATPECAAIPNGACSSWETPSGGGLDLDVYQQHGPGVIVYTATGNDPAEDFEVVPVPAGAVSIYTYAGSQTPTTQAFVNIEYAPRGVPSGLCVSDIVPVAGQQDLLRPCNTVAQKYNPFQSFIMLAADVGDGALYSFQDAPVSLEGTATGLYLSNLRPDAGNGRPGHRVGAGSEPEGDSGLTGAQLWAA